MTRTTKRKEKTPPVRKKVARAPGVTAKIRKLLNTLTAEGVVVLVLTPRDVQVQFPQLDPDEAAEHLDLIGDGICDALDGMAADLISAEPPDGYDFRGDDDIDEEE